MEKGGFWRGVKTSSNATHIVYATVNLKEKGQ